MSYRLACSLLILAGLSVFGGCGPPPVVEEQDDRRFAPGPTDEDAPEEFTATESGLKYRIRRQSTERRPITSDIVTVHYRGWLDNGKEFDTSYATGFEKTFRLSEVVVGWQEGLQLIGIGGMIELEIPPHLGYGEAGDPGRIGPNETLHFQIELIEIQGSPYPDLPPIDSDSGSDTEGA
ncbi:MAG: FKBP-type peptidyl-prolyl cis-trans isomerase [Pirellulaceae bacterium]|jgi:FKBP-type peptidyl-prolyl cis-trans isomerase|nr:FKBP-type peptidyl-prolyl cis-trans isomerase [Pirellulaceae bacterium]